MAEHIDREDLVKHLDILYNRLCEKSPHFHCGFLTALDYVKEFSDVDVAPVVHGYWIEKKSAVGRYFECSNCGAHENKHTAIKGYYCWRCGAKMDKHNEPEN